MKYLTTLFFTISLLSCSNKNKVNIDTSVALNFVNNYVSICNNLDTNLNVQTWIKNNQNLSEAFKKSYSQIIKDSLDFDPIFDAQDYPEEGFKIQKFDSLNNVVFLKGVNWGNFNLSATLKIKDNKTVINSLGVVNKNSN